MSWNSHGSVPTWGGLAKNLSDKLVKELLSTEIFSKRRKIYPFDEEKPECCIESKYRFEEIVKYAPLQVKPF